MPARPIPLGRGSLFAAATVALTWFGGSTVPQPLSGTLHRIWVDPFDRRSSHHQRWFVATNAGEWRDVVIDDRLAPTALALVDQPVTIWLGDSGVAHRLAALPGPAPTPMPGPATIGVQPWLVVLCQFAGEAVFPAREQVLDFFADRPGGLRHYFREVSGGRFEVAVDDVYGWHPMPGTNLDYGGPSRFNLDRATRDCLSVAGLEARVPNHAGILIQFSGSIGASGYGGPATLALGGVRKRYALAWLSGGGTLSQYPGIYAHEIGHGLGLPHSHGSVGQEYGSDFDVMSGSRLVHPIALHKAHLGWLDGSQIVEVGTHARGRRLAMDYLAAGQPAGPIMLRLLVSPELEYSVEARGPTGYDTTLHRNAVVVHRQTRRNGAIDIVLMDSNADPDDGGSGWSPGTTFADPSVGLRLSVDSLSQGQFYVTADGAVTAPATYPVTVRVVGDGVIREAGATPTLVCSTTCTARFVAGDIVRLDPDPGQGMVFDGWSGDCVTSPCEVTVDRERSIHGRFVSGLVQPVAELLVETPRRLDSAVAGDPTPRPDSILVQVIGQDGPYLAWSASSRTTWLVLDRPRGIGSMPLAWQRRPALLQPGQYVDTITVTAPAVGSPARIPVGFVVLQPPNASRAADALIGAGRLTQAELSWLDRLGNRDGRYNLGDLAALIDRGGLPRPTVVAP